MDYSKYRETKQTRSEAVSVNHRALITRTLTKYPVDYALFRELLQNSADARATMATIKFESCIGTPSPTPSTLNNCSVGKLTFQNNGADFETDDWNRLREIARGNPNETKIGAFGVGFYSVFELTDKPLVHSGKDIMAFHFEGDQLHYTTMDGPNVSGTVIDLPYRSPGKLPDLVKFVAFLSQSLMLVPLDKVELKVNDMLLFSISKVTSPPIPLEFPAKFNPYCPTRILKMAGFSSSSLKAEIKYLNATQIRPVDLSTASGLFSFGKTLVSSLVTSTEDPQEYTSLVCFLKKIDAVMDVSVSSSFKKSMQETVMKPPPKQAHMSLLSYSHDDESNSDLKPPLSNYIFPHDFNDSKIFIGFPTKQSTALKSHLALNQLIPTMERTAVDMSNAFVKDWNGQMLYMAGMMARCVYENELRVAATQTEVSKQLKVAVYTMKRFEIGDSAPDPVIGQWVASGFWGASSTILIPSQKGVLPSTEVRFPGSIPSSLLNNTPIISADILGTSSFLDHIKRVGYIKEVSMNEIIRDLEHGPLDLKQFGDLVRWLNDNNAGFHNRGQIEKVLSASVVVGKDGRQRDVTIPLHRARYYQSSATIPDTYPIPSTCLPASFTKSQLLDDLESLKWRELDLVSWLRFIVSDLPNKIFEENIELSEKFAIDVLELLSRSWSRLSPAQQSEVGTILRDVNCIPTQLGMKRPAESYLIKIPLFPDLPVISDKITASRAFLFAVQVRESVDMAFVLKVLHSPDSTLKWSTGDLVQYLSENSRSLQSSDWKILREGEFFENSKDGKLVKAAALYPPVEELKRLQLPTLKWKGSWSSSSKEAELLLRLGLQRGPNVATLFLRAIEANLIPTAIRYYVENFEKNRYQTNEFLSLDLPVIPTSNNGIARPSETFVDKEASLFNLNVISPQYEAYANRLGLARKPQTSVLLQYLFENPPLTMTEADKLFAYLSQRVNEFTKADLASALKQKFIPIRPREKIWGTPSEVFLDTGANEELSGLFSIISPADASLPFLHKVGVKDSPDLKQIAFATAEDPQRVFRLLGSAKSYQTLLTRFRTEWSKISYDRTLVEKLRRSEFLIAHSFNDESESATVGLARAEDIMIVDNIILFNQFKSMIKSAPQESLLEELYVHLGSKSLSQLLYESVELGRVVSDEDARLEAELRIRERLILFLESTTRQTVVRPKDVGKFTVEFTSSIDIRRKLGNTPVVNSPASAMILGDNKWKIWLTPKFDWFHLGETLAKVVLVRPDPESVIILELQLSASLEQLQRKGYNVRRLLKKQQEVEEQEVLKSLELARVEKENKQRLRQQQLEASKAAQQDVSRAAPPRPQGVSNHPIPNSPTSKRPQSSQSQSHIMPHPQSEGSALPPQHQPQPQSVVAKSTNTPPSSSTSKGLWSDINQIFRGTQKPSTDRKLTSNSGVNSQSTISQQPGLHTNSKDVLPSKSVLDQGIRQSRPYSGQTLNSSIQQDAPPLVPVTCSEHRVKDLVQIGALDDGLKIFVRRGLDVPSQSQIESISRFRVILQHCASIYSLPWSTFSVFVDDPATIAFNFGGSLFFNVNVFESLASSPMSKQLDYWFPVVAHELAHNLVKSHGEQHSFYTESYIQTYLEQLHAVNF